MTTLTREAVRESATGTLRALEAFVRAPGAWATSIDDAEARPRVYVAYGTALKSLPFRHRATREGRLGCLRSVVLDRSVWGGAAPYQRQFMLSLLDAHVGRQVRFETSQSSPTGRKAEPHRNLAIV